MSVRLYMDVHVPQAITEQLRRKGVDVLTAIEDGAATLSDDELLERTKVLGRVLFTQDIRFKALAEDWQHEGRQFAALSYLLC
jgi:predicted nuclease of predicted toxin-antitoxin system